MVYWQALIQDIRYSLRKWRQSPLSAMAMMLVLGIGIGGAVTVFTLVYNVVLRPLPYRDPDRLVVFFEENPQRGFRLPRAAPLNVAQWSKRADIFSGVAAARFASFTLTGAGEPVRLTGALITPNLMDVLGVRPALGTGFSKESRNEDAVIISHALWQSRFGGSPKAIGQTLHLDNQSCTIVAVMAASFDFPEQAQVWRPLALEPPLLDSPGRFLLAVGRLRPGVDILSAQAALGPISAQLAQEYPAINEGWKAQIASLHTEVVGAVRPRLYALFGAVLLFLLMACANVGGLLLARASRREKEFAIRAALGASGKRLVHQLFTESVLIGLASGGLGLLMAMLSASSLLAVVPLALPRQAEISTLQPAVIAFTLSASLLTGLAFGMLPALAYSRGQPNPALRGMRSLLGSGGKSGWLLVLQVAAVLVLLAGTGLMARSFIRLSRVDPGTSSDNILTATLSLPQSRYPRPAEWSGFVDQVLERIQSLPSAVHAGAAASLPVAGSGGAFPVWATGRRPDPGKEMLAVQNAVTVDFFAAMGIPVRMGRNFGPVDAAGNPEKLVIVDESLAERLWPGQPPLGNRLVIGFAEPEEFVVCGIVGTVRNQGLEVQPMPAVYLPFGASASPFFSLVIKSQGEASRLADGLREAVWSVDADQPISRLATMDQLLSDEASAHRFSLQLLAGFAAMALLLACLGLYASISNSISRSQREIAIQLALGASRWQILNRVAGKTLILVVLGIAAGLGGAWALTRHLSSLLFEVSPTDGAALASAALVLLAMTVTACLLAARRALRVEIADLLRSAA